MNNELKEKLIESYLSIGLCDTLEIMHRNKLITDKEYSQGLKLSSEYMEDLDQLANDRYIKYVNSLLKNSCGIQL